MNGFKTGAIVTGVIVALVFILSLMCLTQINAGYAGVVYNTNGGVEKNVLSQGWHIVAPWKSVTEYPVSTETVYLSKNTAEGSKDDNSVYAGTADGKPVNLDVSYTYHFDPAKLQHVFTKFRGQEADVISDIYIRRFIKDSLNKVSTQYGVFDIYGIKRSEMAQKMYDSLKDSLSQDGIIIEGFSIIDVRPDEQTQKAIQNKVNAIQALEQVKVEKEKAEIEAQKQKVVAEGNAQARLIEAEGMAKSNAKLQESLTEKVIQQKWIDKWNGALPTVSGSGSNFMIQVPTK